EGELFASRQGECFRWRLKPVTNAEVAPDLEPLALNTPDGFSSLCLMSNRVVFTSQRGSRLTAYHQLTNDHSRWAPTANGLNGAAADERGMGVFGSFTP